MAKGTPVSTFSTVTRKGTRVRLTARRTGSLFTSRTGRPYGPSLWDCDIRVGRRRTQIAMMMTVRTARSRLRRLAERIGRGR